MQVQVLGDRPQGQGRQQVVVDAQRALQVDAAHLVRHRLDRLRGRVAVDRATAPVWVADRLAAGQQATETLGSRIAKLGEET